MKHMLPSLTAIGFCTLALTSAAADPTALVPTRAAVTDMPDIVDMSYADPRSWDRVPPVADGAYVKQEVAERLSGRGNG